MVLQRIMISRCEHDANTGIGNRKECKDTAVYTSLSMSNRTQGLPQNNDMFQRRVIFGFEVRGKKAYAAPAAPYLLLRLVVPTIQTRLPKQTEGREPVFAKVPVKYTCKVDQLILRSMRFESKYRI
uniref:Uncharacterized protein n=1 Tax=Setaria digitata TaxID=48799 RepID=A0A915Q016_9BILA